MSNQRFIVLAFLSGAVAFGLTVVRVAEAVFAALGVGDADVMGLMARSDLVGIVGAVVTFLVLMRHQAAVTFTAETITELAKVTWPDREETVRSTSVVIAATVFVATCLAVYDFVWKRVANVFLFTES
jgi:preprotein translocase SecE subunit